MAKLGSHKRPAVLRVQTKEKAHDILAIATENNWQVIVGIEPDKPENISDLKRLINPPKPLITAHQKIGRNESCSCGSGKKYKKCCATIDIASN